MKKIYLRKGNRWHVILSDKFVLVNDEDFEILKKFSWHLHVNKYACTISPRPNQKNIYMHNLIINCPKGKLIDHINGNGLDNRKENLRLCTPKQNCANVRKRKNCSSIYKGVYLDKHIKKESWASQVSLKNGKRVTIGHFNKERYAAMAYDIWALESYGEFACLNFHSIHSPPITP